MTKIPKEKLAEFTKKAKAIMPEVEEKAEKHSNMMRGKRACIFYCYSPDLNQYETHQLDSVPPYAVIGRTKEIFYLVAPTMKVDDTFVYVVVREFPISITLDMSPMTGKEGMISLIPKGMTAGEIRAKVESIYVNRIYRLKKITDVAWILIVLLPIIAALLGYVFTAAYYNPPDVNHATNSTVEGLRALFRVFRGWA